MIIFVIFNNRGMEYGSYYCFSPFLSCEIDVNRFYLYLEQALPRKNSLFSAA